jgi:DNA-binding PadR family transcriptional regulator
MVWMAPNMGKNEIDLMVLGALVLGPAHGYELKKRITDMFGSNNPKLSNSVIYPRLTQFQNEGYIKSKSETQPNAPTRKVHWLTETGLKRVKELTATPVALSGQMQGAYTDELTVHIVFFSLISKEERRLVIEPFSKFAVARYEETAAKLEKFSATLDRFNLALLEYAVSVLKSTVDFYQRVADL